MDGAKLRLAGYLMLALGVAAGGGYGWARAVHMPQIVEIGSTACGLPIAGARVMLIPENPALEPFEMLDGRILGKVVAVLRKL